MKPKFMSPEQFYTVLLFLSLAAAYIVGFRLAEPHPRWAIAVALCLGGGSALRIRNWKRARREFYHAFYLRAPHKKGDYYASRTIAPVVHRTIQAAAMRAESGGCRRTNNEEKLAHESFEYMCGLAERFWLKP
jgi:hypothetical protein